MRTLTVIYNNRCRHCRHTRRWFAGQECWIELRFREVDDHETQDAYADLPGFGDGLLAIDDEGNTWTGHDAFWVALWASEEWRPAANSFHNSRAGRALKRSFNSFPGGSSSIDRMTNPHDCFPVPLWVLATAAEEYQACSLPA